MDPQERATLKASIDDAIDRYSRRAARCWNWQFQMLVAGAVLYIAWHVIEMWLRTTAASVSV